MKLDNSGQLRRRIIITAAILLAGFSSAVYIYATAGDAADNPFAEFERSKRFAHELERAGGKAALAANDFNVWFAGLWQGETLAYTIAVITAVVAGGYYIIAMELAAEAGRRHDEQPRSPVSPS